MKPLSLFAAVCCIFFSSCSKQEVVSKNSATALTADNSGVKPYCIPCSDTIAIRKNTNNPYDTAGYRHNNGVRAILPTINLSGSNIDSVVLVKVKSYVASIGQNPNSFQSFYNQSVQNGYFPFSRIQRLDSLGNTLYADGLLSSYGNSYVQQIYNYAYQYLNTDTITIAKYYSFATNLISLEATIKNDTRISSWEKEVLLSGCSTGRYSGSYWGNYFNGGGRSAAAQPLFS